MLILTLHFSLRISKPRATQSEVSVLGEGRGDVGSEFKARN